MSQSSSSSSCLTADTHDKKKSEDLEVQQNDILNSNTSRYLVLDFLGKGSFSKVAKCVNLITEKDVALKIITCEDRRASRREIKMLAAIGALDPIKTNIVQFFERFEHKGFTCLAFELLDRNLYQLLNGRHRKPLSLNEIRPIAQQLLTAFDALKNIGVIHADLKADNVMLMNQENQPFRVKLIDFGLSLKTSEVKAGLTVQALGYRAPEVTLGLPFSEAIDMWGLGCVLSLLYLSSHLFGVPCEYQLMRNVVDMLGQPADHLLSAGRFTEKFFKVNRYWDYPKWWLKTPMEYQQATGIEPKECENAVNNLDELVTLDPEVEESIEVEDLRAFVSLLKCLLRTDPEQRISPDKALKHPFISMVHLEEQMDTSLYVDDSYDKMLLEEELTPDLVTEEEPTVKDAPAILSLNPAVPACPGSCDGFSNMSVGAGATGGAEGGSAEEEAAVS